jgi:hypothetical protein
MSKKKKTAENITKMVSAPLSKNYLVMLLDDDGSSYDFCIRKVLIGQDSTVYTISYSDNNQWCKDLRDSVLYTASIENDIITLQIMDTDGAPLKEGGVLNFDYSQLHALKVFVDFIYSGMTTNEFYKIIEVNAEVIK